MICIAIDSTRAAASFAFVFRSGERSNHEAGDSGGKPVEAVPHWHQPAGATRNLTESIVEGASALWRG